MVSKTTDIGTGSDTNASFAPPEIATPEAIARFLRCANLTSKDADDIANMLEGTDTNESDKPPPAKRMKMDRSSNPPSGFGVDAEERKRRELFQVRRRNEVVELEEANTLSLKQAKAGAGRSTRDNGKSETQENEEGDEE